MSGDLPTVAGAISTVIFVISTLPMLFKAFRTKDLRSYSLGNIATANVGNLVQCVYVLSLPVGPIWFLHGFYLVATFLMLLWVIRYRATSEPSYRSEETGSLRSESEGSAGRLVDRRTPSTT